MRSWSVVLVAAALVVAMVYWLRSGEESLPPTGELRTNPIEDDVTAAIGSMAESQDPVPEPGRQVIDTTAATSAPHQAVILGRCIDEQGLPLAGVTASLDVAGVDQPQPVRWSAPAQISTGPDGEFRWQFVPPPQLEVTLSLQGEGRVPRNSLVRAITGGSRTDFGDIVLTRGARIRGTVVDTNDVPREGVQLRLREDLLTALGSDLRWEYSARVSTDSTGEFAVPTLMMPGQYQVSVQGAELVDPSQLMDVVAPSTDLRVIVKRSVDVEGIRGVVVDDTGRPVPDARVFPVGSGARFSSRSSRVSQSDGTFVIPRSDSEDERVRLRVHRTGFQRIFTEIEYPWSARDVRLELRRGIDVEFTVRSDADGQPVERFAFALLAERGGEGISVYEPAARHEDGRAVAEGKRRGTYELLVLPVDGALAAIEPIEVEVADGLQPIEVRLPRAIEQPVVVMLTDGTRLPGSDVQLVQGLVDQPVLPEFRLLDLSEVQSLSGIWKAVLVDEGRTDTSGTGIVRGIAGRSYAINVSGDRHLPEFLTSVVLSETPVEVVVSLGAMLHVSLGPPEFLGDLREQFGGPRTGTLSRRNERFLPRLRIARGEGTGREIFPLRDGALFDGEGVAELTEIRPGAWDLELMSWIGFGSRHTRVIETVRTALELPDGEQVHIELDMSERRRARLRGQFVLGGQPFEGNLEFDADLEGDGTRRSTGAATDSGGRFDVLLPASTWRVGALVRQEDRSVVRAYADDEVTVAPGGDTEVVLQSFLGRLPLRILGPGGEPAEGVSLALVRGNQEINAHCPPTNEDGRTTLTATAGNYVPRVRIRSLSDEGAYVALLSQRLAEARRDIEGFLAEVAVELPVIHVPVTPTAEVEIQLPPEWDR